MSDDVRPGTVVRQDARGVAILLDDGAEAWCAVRGRVHLEGATTSTTTVAVGDRVRVRLSDDGRGRVEEVLRRRSVLARPDPHHERRQHVLAAKRGYFPFFSAVRRARFGFRYERESGEKVAECFVGCECGCRQ